jgi:hypothetical protein
MSTVTLAAVKIANVMPGWDRVETIVVAGTACVLFASVSGLGAYWRPTSCSSRWR